jgi:hypothetical protein
MRKTNVAILTIGVTALAPYLSAAQQQPSTGGIRLEIANRACGAVSPESAESLNPNPSDLNDGDLDDAEAAAIQEGCTLRVSVRNDAGTPLANTQLILVRAAAPDGEFRQFGDPRITDARGNATWRFQPSPDTDYIYEAVSSSRGQQGTRSNSVEIQLCTGGDSVGSIEGAPTTDSGQGCDQVEDGDVDETDNVSDFLQQGPER